MAAKKTATVRAFVALDLDPMSLRRVVRVADRLRMGSGAPSATWVPGPKMHVTLRFMAALPEATIAALSKSLGALCEGKAAPKPCALRLAAFPTIEEAEIVVGGRDGTTPPPPPPRPAASSSSPRRSTSSRRSSASPATRGPSDRT